MTKSLIFGLLCGLGIVGVMVGESNTSPRQNALDTAPVLGAASVVADAPAQLELMTIVAPAELTENAPVQLGVMELRIDVTMVAANNELLRNAPID